MSPRLLALALAVPLVVVAAVRVPPLSPFAALLIPAASIGWALRGSLGGWLLAMAPGVAAVWIVGGSGIAAFAAAILAGPIAARAVRAGASPGLALVLGVLPAAAWTLAVAFSGFDPVPEDAVKSFAGMWGEARVAPERLQELERSAATAVEVLRRTWVASEIVGSWVMVVAAWWLLGRLGERGGGAGLGRWPLFDVPDGWVGVLIAGLALVLWGKLGPADVATTVGGNLVLGSGFVFALRGAAIQSFWMERAGWSRGLKVAVFGAGVILALPVVASVGAGLGLFDAWFDFRRIRTGEQT
ncbi:MAG: DUF2232 domain-containing protein [Candidatus Eiseniibacteriota bacterium]